MESLDNLTMLNLIIGFFSPLVISVINRPTMDAKVKAGIAIGFSIVAGFCTAALSGQFNPEDIIGSILVTFVASITAYNGLFKPTGIAAKVEDKTTPGPTVIVKEDVRG